MLEDTTLASVLALEERIGWEWRRSCRHWLLNQRDCVDEQPGNYKLWIRCGQRYSATSSNPIAHYRSLPRLAQGLHY